MIGGQECRYDRVQAAILALTHPQAPVRATAEQYMSYLCQNDFLTMLDHVFMMADSNQPKNQLMALSYLRHLLHSTQSRFPEIRDKFFYLYEHTQNKMVAECFSVYLNKPAHVRYKKQFAIDIISLLQAEVKKPQPSTIFFQFVIASLGGPIQKNAVRLGPGAAPHLFFSFINQSLSFQPPGVDNNLWMEMLISLLNFSGIPLPMSFIYRSMRRNIPLKAFLNLTIFYNRVHLRMRNLEELFVLTNKQIEITSNSNLMEQIANEGIEVMQQFLRSIRFLLGDVVQIIEGGSDSISDHMIFQFYRKKQIWMHYLSFFAKILEYYGYESYEIIDIAVQVIRILSQFMPSDQLTQCLKLFQQTHPNKEIIYYLLSAMPRFVMELFGATHLLLSQITTFLSSNVRNFTPVFMQFVIRYATVYQYFPSAEVYMAVQQFAEKICTSELILNSSIEPFKLKAQGLVILCRIQKFSIDKSIETKTQFCSQFLGQSLTLLYQMTEANILENSSEVIEILMDGLEYLIELPLYSGILNTQLVTQLVPTLSQSLTPDQKHICCHLINFVKQTYEFSHFTLLTIQIVSLCLNSKIETLQSQACELTLKIAYKINFNSGHADCQEQIEGIKGSGILQFIEGKLMVGEDYPLYSRILLQLVVHPALQSNITEMLRKVCLVHNRQDLYCHYDKIWEALVILTGEENIYTNGKGINTRINEIKKGNCEKMFDNLSIEDRESYYNQIKAENGKIHWTRLREVTEIMERGSYAGLEIQQKLNQLL